MSNDLLFNRKVILRIVPESGGGVEIGELRIDFSIDKTAHRHPNKATIEVYNLNKDLSAMCETKGTSFELFAGYDGDVGLIFRGSARTGKNSKGVKTISNGVDRITQIEAASGAKYYTTAKINKAFGADVTYRQILDEISKTFGDVKLRVPKEINLDEKITGASAFVGRSADVLDQLAMSLGFDWFDDDGAIVITTPDGDTGETAVLLTPSTGLIGPAIKTSKGVDGVSLINSGVRAKRIVEIRTSEVTGFYRVRSVTHKGSSGYSKEFYTQFSAVQIGGTK